MQTMDSSLVDLYNRGLIRKDIALNRAIDHEEIKKYIV